MLIYDDDDDSYTDKGTEIHGYLHTDTQTAGMSRWLFWAAVGQSIQNLLNKKRENKSLATLDDSPVFHFKSR